MTMKKLADHIITLAQKNEKSIDRYKLQKVMYFVLKTAKEKELLTQNELEDIYNEPFLLNYYGPSLISQLERFEVFRGAPIIGTGFEISPELNKLNPIILKYLEDTFGFAVKATAATVNGEERTLFKDPKTDDGTKRSQRGRIVVARKEDVIEENPDFDFSTLTGDQSQNYLLWKDGLNEAEASTSTWKALQPVFLDGELLVDDSLATIRERLQQK